MRARGRRHSANDRRHSNQGCNLRKKAPAPAELERGTRERINQQTRPPVSYPITLALIFEGWGPGTKPRASIRSSDLRDRGSGMGPTFPKTARCGPPALQKTKDGAPEGTAVVRQKLYKPTPNLGIVTMLQALSHSAHSTYVLDLGEGQDGVIGTDTVRTHNHPRQIGRASLA